MIPFDGYGYGQSFYWQYVVHGISKKNGEDCQHAPLLLHIHPVENQPQRVKITVKCKQCESKYEKTEQEIVQVFLDFYGIDNKT